MFVKEVADKTVGQISLDMVANRPVDIDEAPNSTSYTHCLLRADPIARGANYRGPAVIPSRLHAEVTYPSLLELKTELVSTYSVSAGTLSRVRITRQVSN